tara:strand:+ start:6428 stop:7027 length:600 start_codon:yes stop_codon:yes gene_type:complete
MDPEELLIELQQDARLKVKNTLQAIYEVCAEQKKRGLSDFSFSTIARLGEGKGIPKAQSIRNETGEPYRALIKCFENSANKNQTNKKVYKKKLDWIEKIEDIPTRILAGHQAAELARAKKTIKEFTPPNMVIDINDGFAIPGESFNELEKKALEYLISDEFFEKWQFKKGIHGDVLDEKGEKVFKVATLDAIEKALNNL